jgi:hypothetical protein
MALADDLERIARAAAALASPGERVTGIVAVQPLGQPLLYLCAYEAGETRSWLLLDGDERPVLSRGTVRDAAQLAALCEVADESAGGGDLPTLRARLAEIREREAPEGIEDAEAAAAAVAATIEQQPRVATTDYLDRVGAASRRLEQALGDDAGSPFAAAMQQGLPAVDELAADVERNYKGPLA